MTASATKTAIAFAALVSLASTSALARDLTIGLSAEPSSIDPHFHNLSPQQSDAAEYVRVPDRTGRDAKAATAVGDEMGGCGRNNMAVHASPRA